MRPCIFSEHGEIRGRFRDGAVRPRDARRLLEAVDCSPGRCHGPTHDRGRPSPTKSLRNRISKSQIRFNRLFFHRGRIFIENSFPIFPDNGSEAS